MRNCMMPQGHPTHCGCEPFEKPSVLKTTNVRYATSTQPAEADGVEVVGWRIGFPNGAGYRLYEQRQDWAYENYGQITYEVQDLMTVANHQRILSAVTAERDRLRLDAERYRWLRDKSESLHSFYLSTPLWMTGVRFRPENMDSTIDAAMAAKEGGQ